MGAEDLLQEAIEELYSVDPDEFTERRTALAAHARTTGDKATAKDIAALRKPTRSAYTLNQLVRSDPDAAAHLAELGADLRAAQESLDGAQLRELSTRRRGMVEELADQAFQVAGQRSPAAGLREEVVSTLNAAVADESVVDQLRSATLLRPARWDGFGFAHAPELSVVRSSNVRQPRQESAKTRPETRTRREASVGTAEKAPSKAARRAEEAAERAAAEEERRSQARASAERAVSEADSAVSEATQAEDEQRTEVRILHEQLTDARRRLDEIRIDVRRAENRQRKAQQALDRLKQ